MCRKQPGRDGQLCRSVLRHCFGIATENPLLPNVCVAVLYDLALTGVITWRDSYDSLEAAREMTLIKETSFQSYPGD